MFTNLHCHTGIGSILDSTIFIEEIPKRAKELGMKSAAITEHGYLTSSIEFYTSCLKEGIKPIIGCEMYVTDDINVKDSSSQYYHLILLSKNTTGYNNLKELCTIARLHGFYKKPRVDFELLSKYSDGLICSTACLGGELPKMIIEYNKFPSQDLKNKIDNFISKYKNLFGSDFYLELQSADNEEQEIVNKELVKLSKLYNIKIIATSDAHFLYKEDFDLHATFINMNQDRDNEVYKDCWYKSESEMFEILDKQVGHNVAKEAIDNTQEISDKCNLKIDLGHSYLPKVHLPYGINTEEEYIWKLIKDGMIKKGYNDKPEYWDRINYEMNVITKKDFIGYFLILGKLIKECKEKDIPIAPARGSAGGSLVADVLDITSIDPLKYGLDFGRFLTMERMSPPDIDTDFASSCRYEAIHMARKEYGEENVAQVMTFTNMQAKAIIDAVGKVMKVDKCELKHLKDLLVDGKPISETLVGNPKVPKELQKLVKYCGRLEGLPRSTSLHAGGLVICPQGHSMSEYTAMTLSKEGEIAVQCTKETVEQVGLVKYDFLATSVLDIINDTVKSIGSSYYDFEYDYEDEKVWDYICSCEQDACFQTESEMMKSIIKKIKPRSIEELCAVISLGRPDTMGEVDSYAKRKEGIEDVEYYDDILKPVLEPTYGTMIYQETFMQIAKVYAGYTDGEADKLRKGLGKKNKDLVKAEADKFYHKAIELGRPKDVSRKLADIMSEKGGYCFNKSHGIAYAIVSYMTSYLKYYYPVEFMTSVLNNQKKPETGAIDFDSVKKYIKSANDMGIEVNGTDINISKEQFVPDSQNKRILYGFGLVKGLTSSGVQTIMENRPFSSYKDFINRIGLELSKSDVIALIKSGSFDYISGSTKEKMFKYYFSVRFDNKKEEKKPINKANKTHVKWLLDNGYITPEQQDDKESCTIIINKARKKLAWEEFEDKYCQGTELDWEMETLNAFLSGNPFEGVKLPDWSIVKKDSVGFLGGTVLTAKETTVKKGKQAGQKMMFINIDTKYGVADIVVFPREFVKYKDLLKAGHCLVCKINKQGDLKGVLNSCETLSSYLEKTANIQ